jgi:hypothetical protein
LLNGSGLGLSYYSYRMILVVCYLVFVYYRTIDLVSLGLSY